MGTVIIRSNPAGAIATVENEIGGNESKTTPAQFHLDARKEPYTFIIKKDKYEDLIKKVIVKDDKRTLKVEVTLVRSWENGKSWGNKRSWKK